MEGQDFAVFGVVEGKDDLVIIDEHRVQEDFNEPLLTVRVGAVHVCELIREEPDEFLVLGGEEEAYGISQVTALPLHQSVLV